MDNSEFKKLAEATGLKKTELAKALGVGRVTVYNWLKDGVIPDSKEDFIRGVLIKSPDELKNLIDNGENFKVEKLVSFVVKNFDEFLEHKDFRNRMYAEAYELANVIIEKKSNELLDEAEDS